MKTKQEFIEKWINHYEDESIAIIKDLDELIKNESLNFAIHINQIVYLLGNCKSKKKWNKLYNDFKKIKN